MRRVVVTGIGALTPIGNNVAEYAAALKAGVSGASPITRFDSTKFKTQFACEVKGFDPAKFLDRREYRRADAYAQYALVSTAEAMADSGLEIEKINLERAGFVSCLTPHSEIF